MRLSCQPWQPCTKLRRNNIFGPPGLLQPNHIVEWSDHKRSGIGNASLQ